MRRPSSISSFLALALFSLCLSFRTGACPSPTSTNAEAVIAVDAPVFDVTRGFYTKPQLVTITSTTPGVFIRYTTNGSLPTTTVGTLYSGPVTISRTSPLRAIAYTFNAVTSKITTHTYIFVDDVITQSSSRTQSVYGLPSNWKGVAPDYGMDSRVTSLHKASVRDDLKTIPSLSVVMETNDLFGPNGIYSNPTNSGVLWERATSLELIDPDHPNGSKDFQIDCGIRIQGGAFRRFGLTKKKSFRVLFKGIYGATKLDYPLFGPDATQEFDTLVFRMNSNDGYQWGNRTNVQYARDAFGRRTQLDMSSPASRGRFMHLYLNGVYWGLYNVVERPDASFGKNYFGANKAEWDGVNAGSPTNSGSLWSWNNLMNIVKTISSAPNEAARTAAFMTAQGLNPDGTANASKADFIDIDNYIDYLLVNYYCGNSDWPHRNYYHGRERDLLDPLPLNGSRSSTGTHFFSWDAEWIMFLGSINDPTGNVKGVGEPYGHLRNSKEFRVRFGDRVQRALFNGGALTTQRCKDRYADITKDHRSILIPELARWGDQHGTLRTIQNWTTEYDHIQNSWLSVRTPALVNILRNAGLFPTLNAPAFNHRGGEVQPGWWFMMLSFQGLIYYTLDGSDPRAIGGGIAPGAILWKNAFQINVSTTVKARVFNGTDWSPLHEARFLVDSISINEVLAKNTVGIRDPAGEYEDWIELHNKNALPVTVGGMYLSDSPANPTRWRIPAGQAIQPGGTLLIWADDDPTQGPLHATFKLSSAGEEVLLYDIDGTLLDRLTFGAQVPDVSTGRLHDGLSHQVSFPDPTPGLPNDILACGSRRYSSLDPTVNRIDLNISGTPGLGKSIAFNTSGGSGSGPSALLGSGFFDELPLGVTTARLLLNTPAVFGLKATGLVGASDFQLTIPNLPALVGQRVYFQAWELGAIPWSGSSGLEVKICP